MAISLHRNFWGNYSKIGIYILVGGLVLVIIGMIIALYKYIYPFLGQQDEEIKHLEEKLVTIDTELDSLTDRRDSLKEERQTLEETFSKVESHAVSSILEQRSFLKLARDSGNTKNILKAETALDIAHKYNNVKLTDLKRSIKLTEFKLESVILNIKLMKIAHKIATTALLEKTKSPGKKEDSNTLKYSSDRTKKQILYKSQLEKLRDFKIATSISLEKMLDEVSSERTDVDTATEKLANGELELRQKEYNAIQVAGTQAEINSAKLALEVAEEKYVGLKTVHTILDKRFEIIRRYITTLHGEINN
jgi:hypothetical protein